MDRLIKFVVSFISMNLLRSGAKSNMKDVTKQFLDIGITLNKVSKDGKITKEEQQAIAKESMDVLMAIVKMVWKF